MLEQIDRLIEKGDRAALLLPIDGLPVVVTVPEIQAKPASIDLFKAKLEQCYNASDSADDSAIDVADSVPETLAQKELEPDALSDSATDWSSSAAKENAPIRGLSLSAAKQMVQLMQDAGLSRKAIIEKLWGRKEGGYPAWKKAVAELKELIK